MTTELQAYQGNQFSKEQVELIKRTIAPKTTDDELKLFLEVCKHHRLNPFARHLYAIKRNEYDAASGSYRDKMTIQTSIDGYRLLAQRSGNYGGQTKKEWCGKDGKWFDVWLSDEPPAAARAGVFLKDLPNNPTYAVATYTQYCAKKKDGAPTPIWQRMPALMLAKCAEALALRELFPGELAGIYTDVEMAQADNDLPAQVLAHETVIEAQVVETEHITKTPVLANPKGQTPALLRMIEQAQKRVEKLGLVWEDVKREALSETIPDDQLEMKHFAFINSKITDLERQGQAVGVGK